MSRKCIYTNKEANSKDNVIPKKKIGGELHNWANKAPVSKDYKDLKQDSMPTDLEFEANQLFHKLELAKLEVKFYEDRLAEIQQKIKETTKIPEKKSKKDKEIEQMYIEKEVVEGKEDIKNKDVIDGDEGVKAAEGAPEDSMPKDNGGEIPGQTELKDGCGCTDTHSNPGNKGSDSDCKEIGGKDPIKRKPKNDIKEGKATKPSFGKGPFKKVR